MHPEASAVCRLAAASVALWVVGVAPAHAQESKSAPVVKEFVAAAGSEMRYVAAKVPGSADEYVAALHIPGVQLLVIQARYTEPSLLDAMLSEQNYQGVYSDLNSASYAIAESRVFFEDLRADGIYAKRQDENSAFDIFERAGKRLLFDGDWRKQQLSEQDYQQTYSSADDGYAKAVVLLTAALKKSS
jgi:hypothetical protein